MESKCADSRDLSEPRCRFVVMCESDPQILGPFDAYGEAVAAGRERWLHDRFTVMRVEPHDEPNAPAAPG